MTYQIYYKDIGIDFAIYFIFVLNLQSSMVDSDTGTKLKMVYQHANNALKAIPAKDMK